VATHARGVLPAKRRPVRAGEGVEHLRGAQPLGLEGHARRHCRRRERGGAAVGFISLHGLGVLRARWARHIRALAAAEAAVVPRRGDRGRRHLAELRLGAAEVAAAALEHREGDARIELREGLQQPRQLFVPLLL
jgi:hypothetical protein